MAILYPPLEIIQKLKVQPTPGERKLLEVLIKELDDNYEVFFQPFVNGDNPDFAILKKDGGVLLIEVKDWNLNYYKIDEKFKWRLKKDGTRIISPFDQLNIYKSNLFHMHIEGLHNKLIENSYNWVIIGCAVYFHGSTMGDFLSFVESSLPSAMAQKYLEENKTFGIITQDNLSNIKNLPKKFGMHAKSVLFDEFLYNKFLRTLKPPFHYSEQGKEIIYTTAQRKIVESNDLQRRKIKGIAGCGKSLVLAKRAVTAHKLTGEKVLILTYNLSLINYIRDRISDVRENFDWGNFHITNYHQFFKGQAIKHNLYRNGISCYNNVHFFKPVKDRIKKYRLVYIDEIQDYRQEWIDIIFEYFVEKNGCEIIVFGDEKQNIYDRPLDHDKEIVIPQVPGKWNNSLTIPFRFTADIAHIVMDFQDEFLAKKYHIERSIDELTPWIDFGQKNTAYIWLNDNDPELITKTIFGFIRKNAVHSSDCAVIASTIKILRLVEQRIRLNEKEATTVTFETQEEYDKIVGEWQDKNQTVAFPSGQYQFESMEDNPEPSNDIEYKLERIRRSKKVHFYMGTGTIKISTIHSFKGWESHTVILLVGGREENKHENFEMIYTGMTRARKNILIINLGNPQLHNFFHNQIQISQVMNFELVDGIPDERSDFN